MPELTWIGKSAVVNHHQEIKYRLLHANEELSVGDPGQGNLLVEGDNLHALKALLPYYAGKVKCVYIDPPYNTGNEGWAYNDNVKAPEMQDWLHKVVGRDDLSRHDKWLCMMYPRLALLRQFLRDDGAIFVSIDDNALALLRLVLDEVFGPRSFIASFVWQKRRSPDNDEKLATSVHDNIVCYAKDKSACRLNRFKRTDEADARYDNPDNDPRGPWTSSDLTRREYREHDYYEITLPSGRKVTPAAGRSWGVPPESFEALRGDNRIWFGPNGDAMPRRKRFLAEVAQGIVPTTWWTSDLFGDNQASKREVRYLFPELSDIFQTPKPTKLLQRIVELAADRDSLVLDSFAGSGTTGHAVMQLNKEDGGNRRFILVEMEKDISRGITAERLKRVIEGYGDKEGLGGGFRYCTLAEPLFDERGQVRTDVRFPELARHIFFTETGEPLPEGAKLDSPLVGVHADTAIYLLFNGILGDKRVNGGNVLTSSLLKSLPPHNGPRMIFGEGCRLTPDRLKREGITFKQIPYQVKVS